ncbi:hypothetical protein T10_1262 [Trichinella papuae]|uniref:Uncharacterized protein n=1 Tax=Trichinella papuae TaxID=268474 RepID=A0A0V1N7N9_9BILA|nr:hypothetical protein T10_1262 [Trichinella papuae]
MRRTQEIELRHRKEYWTIKDNGHTMPSSRHQSSGKGAQGTNNTAGARAEPTKKNLIQTKMVEGLCQGDLTNSLRQTASKTGVVSQDEATSTGERENPEKPN